MCLRPVLKVLAWLNGHALQGIGMCLVWQDFGVASLQLPICASTILIERHVECLNIELVGNFALILCVSNSLLWIYIWIASLLIC